jgi:hypothetical protein
MRDTVQEATDRFALANTPGIVDQYQERGLKRIFGSMGVVQDAAANAEHRRAVSLQKQGKSRLFAALAEAIQ